MNKTVRIIIWITIGLVVLAVLFWLGVGAVAADRLTVPTRLFDEKHTPDSFGLAYEEVEFVSRDGKTQLAGWYLPSGANERVIVFVHGRNASRTAAYGGPPAEEGNQPPPGKLLEFSADLHKAGFSVFIFDLRGHGKSGEGRFSFGVFERLDVLAALDWLQAKGFQPGKIGLMGLSLGAPSSIGAVATEMSVGALVIDSSFADLAPIVRSQWVEESGLPLIFLVPTRWMVRLRYGWDLYAVKPVEEIRQIANRPLLIIHCQDDMEIPLSHFEQLKAAAPSAQTWLLPHCVHGQTYNSQPEVFSEKVVEFFDSNLR